MDKQSTVKSGKMTKPTWLGSIETAAPFLLIFISVVVAVIFCVISAGRPLTHLEGALLQAFNLGAALGGAYVFGMRSAKSAAQEMIKPHARSAFRRVLSLYQSLSRLALAIAQARDSDEKSEGATPYLDTLEAIVTEQIATANDAIEDWRDIVPEDVEEVEMRWRKRQHEEQGGF